MVIIGWKELSKKQPYSRQHVSRLEKDGKFPQRVKLGQNRIGWVLEEIEAHLEKLALNRDTADIP